MAGKELNGGKTKQDVGNQTKWRSRGIIILHSSQIKISIPVIFPNSKFSGDLEINRVEEDYKQTVGYGRYI